MSYANWVDASALHFSVISILDQNVEFDHRVYAVELRPVLSFCKE